MTPVHSINGAPADVAGLGAALANYGHFTSMQVRGHAVRGLSLHFERLRAATRELFDADLDADAVRGWMAAAARDFPGGDGALRVQVFSRAFELRDPARALPVDVLVTASRPADPGDRPLRVRTQSMLRPSPHLKHVATFPLFDAMRQARQAGVDDALLVSPEGRVLEGSVWNVVFADADGLVWPEGPMLDGITQQLLRAQLAGDGAAPRTSRIDLDDLPRFDAAYALSSLGVRAIGAIDDVAFPASAAGLARLRGLIDAIAPEPLAAGDAIV